jgi:hypothetical protein
MSPEGRFSVPFSFEEEDGGNTMDRLDEVLADKEPADNE